MTHLVADAVFAVGVLVVAGWQASRRVSETVVAAAPVQVTAAAGSAQALASLK